MLGKCWKIPLTERQKSVSARAGGADFCPEYATTDAKPGHDQLVVVFDTGQKDGMPPFPTLTDEEGTEYRRRGETWDYSMGSKVKVWWDVPTKKSGKWKVESVRP